MWIWVNVRSLSSELFYRGTCRLIAPFAPLIESRTCSQPHTPPPPSSSPQQFVCLCATAGYGTACPAALSVPLVSCVVKKCCLTIFNNGVSPGVLSITLFVFLQLWDHFVTNTCWPGCLIMHCTNFICHCVSSAMIMQPSNVFYMKSLLSVFLI